MGFFREVKEVLVLTWRIRWSWVISPVGMLVVVDVRIGFGVVQDPTPTWMQVPWLASKILVGSVQGGLVDAGIRLLVVGRCHHPFAIFMARLRLKSSRTVSSDKQLGEPTPQQICRYT